MSTKHPTSGHWVDRALEIAHDTGFSVQWDLETDPVLMTIKLPDHPEPLPFHGRTLDEAAWALCVSEFPDPDDRPEVDAGPLEES